MKALASLYRLTFANPVAIKELRIGLRERRIFILQVLFLFILLAFSLLILPDLFRHRSSERLSEAGREFFYVLFWIQFFFLALVVPAFTSGSLSGERERHCLDMVMASRLSSAEIVLGKLGFACYCLLLLISSVMPLASMAFFLGGISIGEVASAYLELFLFGMLTAGLGLFSSARENRSTYSTVQAYLLVGASLLLLPFYLGLRFEGDSPTLKIGPSFWTGQQVWEFGAFHFTLGASLYGIFFLAVKACHRIRPQAATLRAMAVGFMLFYFYSLAWSQGFFLQEAFKWGKVSQDSLLSCVLYLMLHLLILGFFLEPNPLESSQQQQQFSASLFSKSLFWLSLLALGMGLPAILATGLGLDSGLLTFVTLVGLFYLFLYPINVSLVRRLFLPHWNFSWVYFIGLGLLQLGPALGLLSPEDSLFRLYFVSPLITIFASIDPDFPQNTVPLALGFQVALALLLCLALWLKSRRRRG